MVGWGIERVVGASEVDLPQLGQKGDIGSDSSFPQLGQKSIKNYPLTKML